MQLNQFNNKQTIVSIQNTQDMLSYFPLSVECKCQLIIIKETDIKFYLIFS